MPKKGYKALTIKDDVYDKFMREVKEAKKSEDSDNSKFLNKLIEEYRKKKH